MVGDLTCEVLGPDVLCGLKKEPLDTDAHTNSGGSLQDMGEP